MWGERKKNRKEAFVTLLVLAAGMGSRYGGLKQIEPVGPHGEIILDYAVYDAVRVGFRKVVFVIRKEIEEVFRERIGTRYRDAAEVEYVFQELTDLPGGLSVPEGRVKPWGTGHAIWTARKVIDEPFLPINADDFYGPSSYEPVGEFLKEVNPTSCQFCMVGFTLRETLSSHGSVARGVCQVDEEGFLVEVVEHTKIERAGERARSRQPDGGCILLTGDEKVSLNMWGFTPQIFSHLERLFQDFLSKLKDSLKEEFFIPSAVQTLVETQQATVRVLPTDASWIGVTYPEDKPLAQKAIRDLVSQGTYPSPLFLG